MPAHSFRTRRTRGLSRAVVFLLAALTACADGPRTELARLTEPAAGVVEIESCGMALSGSSPLFSPGIVWDAWRDRGVARVGAGYQIDVFDGSTLVASYRRAVDPVKADRDLAKRQLGEGMRMMTSAGVRECEWEEVIEKRGVAEVIPATETDELDVVRLVA